MALSREEKLLHILGAIDAAGADGALPDKLDKWIQLTLRRSGQAVYVYIKDLRTRKWIRQNGAGRYFLTDDGRLELSAFKTQTQDTPLAYAVQSPTP